MTKMMNGLYRSPSSVVWAGEDYFWMIIGFASKKDSVDKRG